MDQYRVRVETYEGRPLIMELQPDRKSAMAYAESLMEDGGVLDGLPLDGVTVAVDEMCNGDWTLATQKLVRMR